MSNNPIDYKDLGFTDTAMKVLKERYLHKDPVTGEQETIIGMFNRVSKTVAQGDRRKQADYMAIMLDRYFLPNSPTLMNAGRSGRHGQLSACYVLPVEDSMDGIFSALKNQALIHKFGGGTGFNFSHLRPKGAAVNSTGGVATGPVSFMELFDMATEKVQQGGCRRGANMGILNIDHPDILDFITSKLSGDKLTNFNISVGMTDEFMQKVVDGTLDEREKEIWSTIITSAWRSGDPGLVFLGTINKKNKHPELGELEATNPCLRGDSKILTDKGYFPIKDLVGKIVNIWNGYEWSTVEPAVTGHNQKMLRVAFSNGSTVDCTHYHKFVLNTGERVEAKDLKEGDILYSYKFPVIESINPDEDADYMYCAGFYSGDGTRRTMEAGKTNIVLYAEKQKLLPLFKKFMQNHSVDTANDKTRVGLNPDLYWIKDFVPSAAFTVKERLAWLAGLIDSDGTRNSADGALAITSVNYDFLVAVKDMLNTLGASGVLSKNRDAGMKPMPDGKGGVKEYACKTCYRLVISAWNSKNLQNIGLKTHRVNIKCNPQRNAGRKIRVVSVTACEMADTVYCLNEPKRHTLVVNGISTGNCAECPLHDFEACNLGSINLSRFVTSTNTRVTDKLPIHLIDWDKLRRVVHIAVDFLNDVIDVNCYPLPEIAEAVRRSRKIGLGVMGWADMLNKLGVRYGSDESLFLAQQVMCFIHEEGHRASRGRNRCVTCIAPTGTISLIAGCSSGIEPLFALEYDRIAFAKDENADGSSRKQVLHYVDPEYLAARNNPEDRRIELGVFVTAQELSYQEHIKMQAAFQEYTDLAVSKTINLPNKATLEDIDKAYRMAWLSDCCGITVYRDGCKNVQVLYKTADDESQAEVCPECGSASVVRESGCKRCTQCGWSPCSV